MAKLNIVLHEPEIPANTGRHKKCTERKEEAGQSI